MFIVAGPPGAGKSKAFPVAGFGVDFFNADDRASALNGGSYIDIPRRIRDEVNILFESFVPVTSNGARAVRSRPRSEAALRSIRRRLRIGPDSRLRCVTSRSGIFRCIRKNENAG
jgi:hypothetical protein